MWIIRPLGHAIITRLLEARGYRVAILSQPDWQERDIMEYGRPRLGFLVSAGNMDSMVNHYSVSRKRRKRDAYTPGGEMGRRPDYAAVVYGNLIRQAYKDDRSSWAGSRPACGVWPTMITGRTG